MPERDDPEFANRQGTGGPSDDAHDNPVDDPLAELARIVSGRSSIDEPSEKPIQPASSPKPAGKPSEPETDILGDLEAELLSNLQASFSAVQQSVREPKQGEEPPKPAAGPPPPAAGTSPPAAPPETPADDAGGYGAPPPRVSGQEAPQGAGAPQQPPSPPPEEQEPKRRWPPLMDEIDDDWSSEFPATIRPGGAASATPGQAPAVAPPPVQAPPDDRRPPQPPSAAPDQAPGVQPQQPQTQAPQPAAPQAETPPQPSRSQRPPFLGKRVDIGSLPLRRNTAAEAAPESGEQSPSQSTRAPQSRWEEPARPHRSPGIERFAPAGARDVTERPAPNVRQPAPEGVEPPDRTRPMPGRVAASPAAASPPAVEQAQIQGQEHAQASTAPGGGGFQPPRQPEAQAAAPAAAADDDYEFDFGLGEDDMSSFENEDLDHLIGRRRPGIGLMAVAGALALVVIVGGLSLFVFRSTGTNAEPPVIAADTSATREGPPTQDVALADGQNKLIYDRVDDAADSQSPTVLLPGTETLTDRDATQDDNPISRVILPDGLDGGSAEQADARQPGTDVQEPIGPRRVRTVVVRPDGTIVSNQTSEEGEPLDLAGGNAGPASTGTEAQQSPAADTPSATEDDVVAIAGPDALDGGNELAITPLDDGGATTSGTTTQTATTPPPQPVETQPTPTQRPAADTEVATRNSDGPLDLTQGGGTTTQTQSGAVANQPATTSGGMMVQVSSQRSEDAARATFRDLQGRYPSILGGYDLDIQRADLGERGIYFRVRVGPFPPSDAQRLCDDLKTAGGDCILSRG